MKNNLPDNKRIVAVNNYWKKIQDDYNHLLYHLDFLHTEINVAVHSCINEQGIFLRDDAVDVLSECLAQYDISKQTIKKYYNEIIKSSGDVEDFIQTLKIIVHAKCNALLPKDFTLYRSTGEHGPSQKRLEE